MTIEAACRRAIRPEPLLTVSSWADRHRRLSSKDSAEPGPWRTSRTPYLREIMDCLSPSSPIETVVFMKGAQIGATATGLNWIGFVIAQAPGPMLAVQPTVEMSRRFSRQRLDPLVIGTPALSGLISEPRARDSQNTMMAKEFQGGTLILTGANSPIGLRSAPIRYLFLDQIDGYPADAQGEGDPIALAVARTETFSRRKIFMTSMPTIKDYSRIEAAWLETDRRLFFVPCIHCGDMAPITWARVQWPEGRPEEAFLLCRVLRRRHARSPQAAAARGRRVAGNSDWSGSYCWLSSLWPLQPLEALRRHRPRAPSGASGSAATADVRQLRARRVLGGFRRRSRAVGCADGAPRGLG